MSRDLPYPKSGYYNKQQVCDDCVEDGCPTWWIGTGGTQVFGVYVGLCVAGMIACRALYVGLIVPNERSDLVTKVLAADTVRTTLALEPHRVLLACTTMGSKKK